MILHTIVVPLILTASLGRSTQTPQGNSGSSGVIDENLSSLIQGLMQANNITGMSLGIVSPNGDVEFGAWGNKTESGESIAPDVGFIFKSSLESS
jgi:hypothetical protein